MDESGTPKWVWNPLLWCFLGVLIGALGIQMARSSADRPLDLKSLEAQQVTFEAPKAQVPSPQVPAKSPVSGSPLVVAPMDPLLGDIRMPEVLPGQLPAQGLPSVGPSAKTPGIQSGPSKPTESILVTIELRTTDVDSAQSALTATARGLGGSLFRFEEPIDEGGSELRGVLAYVPQPGLEAFLDRVGKLGSASREVWRGSASERQTRIEAEHRNRIQKLLKKREELLQDFTDDAPSVMDVDEQIAAVRKQFVQVRAPAGSAQMVAFRITLHG